jgi:hypothetical protein
MWNKPFNYEWLVQLQNLSHKFILHCHFEKYIMKVFYCIVHIQKTWSIWDEPIKEAQPKF